jgi:hypothetical protein
MDKFYHTASPVTCLWCDATMQLPVPGGNHPNTGGGPMMVQHPGGPTTPATIKPTLPLKISPILMSVADLDPSTQPVNLLQWGASENAMGLLVHNQK